MWKYFVQVGWCKKYRVLAWNSRWRSLMIMNSIWHNDIIITWHSWLVLSCIGSQWAHCSIFKYMTSACCISCSMLQKPSTFPSSTCIDLLQGDSYMLYGGYLMYVIFAAAVFLTCSQQHVVDVLTVASLGACSAAAAAADLFRQDQIH